MKYCDHNKCARRFILFALYCTWMQAVSQNRLHERCEGTWSAASNMELCSWLLVKQCFFEFVWSEAWWLLTCCWTQSNPTLVDYLLFITHNNPILVDYLLFITHNNPTLVDYLLCITNNNPTLVGYLLFITHNNPTLEDKLQFITHNNPTPVT